MVLQCSLQDRQLLVCLAATQALLCFQHPGAQPWQVHPGITSALYVATHHLVDDTVDTLDHVGPGERTPEFRRQSEPDHREDLVQSVEYGAGDARAGVPRCSGPCRSGNAGFGVSAPKLRRIALLRAFAPSTTISRQVSGSSPRSIRLSSSAWITATRPGRAQLLLPIQFVFAHFLPIRLDQSITTFMRCTRIAETTPE